MHSIQFSRRCRGWCEDLPAPNDPPLVESNLGNQPPNHQDYIYLEIPRSTMLSRNWILFFVSLNIPTTIAFLAIAFLPPLTMLEIELILVIVFLYTACSYVNFHLLRASLSPPLDEPIRFNRARQKIYAYNFKYSRWNALAKQWGIHPVSYDWAQLRAEHWIISSMHHTIRGVTLSVLQPGTDRVVDRFILSINGANQHAWAYICNYMQKGPCAVPPPEPPKDHDDILWCELASRWAPKVIWPASMDLESRTAPALADLESEHHPAGRAKP